MTYSDLALLWGQSLLPLAFGPCSQAGRVMIFYLVGSVSGKLLSTSLPSRESLMLWLPCLILQGLHISAVWLHKAGPLSIWTLSNVSVNEIWPDSLVSAGNSEISKSIYDSSINAKACCCKGTVPFDKFWDSHISSYYVAIWDLSCHSYQSHSGFIQLDLLI